MDESVKNSPCKECEDGDEGQLQAELDHLRQHLAERDSHIVALETEFIKCSSRTSELEEQVSTWREKYERLYDSHKRVQKLNQVLEDKLLQMVDKMKGEKSQLTRDIATLSVRLAESKHNYSMLQKENERYKNDMNLAIQLLQCKPDNFVSQKLDNLPVDTQARVSQYVMSKSSKPSSSNSAKNGNEIDTFDTSEYEFNISASLMTKILEDSIHDTVTKHCDTCTCSKSQNKPFSYNESYYSVATQTVLSGEMKNSLCLNCNADIKSIHSSLSIRSSSPHAIKLVNDKTINHCANAPLYIIPQPIPETNELNQVVVVPEILKNLVTPNDKIIVEEKVRLEEPKATSPNIDVMQQKRKNSMNMEPAVHHKLCDRTKTSMSSKKSSIHSSANEDLLIRDLNLVKDKIKSESHSGDMSLRKNSVGSMGGVSRTSSLAKSTVSTQNKSNTQVGPGPRFCHLRMQAGSKNILLDNAQPDVPPVLYRRQSKCNDNTIFKDLNDGMDNFIDLEKNIDDEKDDCKNDNVVVESTLIDVHIDNNNKESDVTSKDTSINPVLLNVSSSPLQPLKTHNFSNSSEYNNNNSHSIGSHRNTSDNDNLLNDFNTVPNVQNNNVQNNNNVNNNDTEKHDIYTPPSDNHDVKIFNFDRYEQNKLGNQYARPLRKIDMSQLHTLENTKISKDFPPQGEIPKLEKKSEAQQKTPIPAIVNVYPNLTQTHLKVNDNKKIFTNEQSTSSLSSDDSAALLQKQQLLRVAEWVEQNLEQQNNLNDPLEDDVSFSNRINRRESKLTRLSETLNELALNMPHPVSKYAKFNAREGNNNWVHNNVSSAHDKVLKHSSTANSSNVTKETVFPIDSGETTVVEVKKGDAIFNSGNTQDSVMSKELRDAFKSNGDKDITREELARMEYNVKKFLLSGPHWANPESVGRSRRTSSKTETDV